jgi:hypothetical protein
MAFPSFDRDQDQRHLLRLCALSQLIMADARHEDESDDLTAAESDADAVLDMPRDVLLAIMQLLSVRERFVFALTARANWSLLHSPELWERVVSAIECLVCRFAFPPLLCLNSRIVGAAIASLL